MYIIQMHRWSIFNVIFIFFLVSFQLFLFYLFFTIYCLSWMKKNVCSIEFQSHRQIYTFMSTSLTYNKWFFTESPIQQNRLYIFVFSIIFVCWIFINETHTFFTEVHARLKKQKIKKNTNIQASIYLSK